MPSDGLLRKALEAAPVGLTLSDARGSVLMANGAARAFQAARADGAKPPIVERRADFTVAGERYCVEAATDIAEQQALQDKLFHMAYFDLLTGCPNRALFEFALAESIATPGDATPTRCRASMTSGMCWRSTTERSSPQKARCPRRRCWPCTIRAR